MLQASHHERLQYYWALKGPAPKNDVEDIGVYFNEMRTKLGVEELSTKVVVKDAKRKRSILHREFDWNVERAANTHWEAVAGRLLRGVCAVWVTESGETVRGRTEVYVKKHKAVDPETGVVHIYRGGYYPTESIAVQPERLEYTLSQALKALASFRTKYAFLLKMAGVSSALDALEAEIRLRKAGLG